MRAFEIQVNGKKLCTAGLSEYGAVTTILHWVGRNPKAHPPELWKEEMSLDVGGGVYDGPVEYLTWAKRKLRVGDEITIKVVEVDRASKPVRREQRDPALDLAMEKKHLRKRAKQFGWEIRTRPAKRSTKR